MFKINPIDSMYLFFILSFAMIIFSYIVLYMRVIKINIISNETSKISLVQMLSFINKLTVEDFNTYEKYDIWRFCIEK